MATLDSKAGFLRIEVALDVFCAFAVDWQIVQEITGIGFRNRFDSPVWPFYLRHNP